MISGLARLYDVLFPIGKEFRDFFLNFLGKSNCESNEPLHFLDVGCGTGALLSLASSHGWRVTGIDPDSEMLAVAKAKLRAFPLAQLRAASMFDPLPEQNVHRITCTGNTLSFSCSKQDAGIVLQYFHNSLAPEGRILIQTVNWDSIGKYPSFDFPVLRTSIEGSVVRFYRHYEQLVPHSTVRFDTILESNGKRRAQSATMIVLRADDLTGLVKDAGFGQVKRWGDFAGNPWRRQSPITVLVASRT